MNIYICELSILAIVLCPLLTSSSHLYSNYYSQRGTQNNLHKEAKTFPSPERVKREKNDGLMRPEENFEAASENLSRLERTGSDENKYEEKIETFDDYRENQTDGNNNDPMLLDNNEPTKTYERVVLEGSKIRISCPHLLSTSTTTSIFTTSTHSIPPELSFPAMTRNEALNKQLFAPASIFKLRPKKERRPIVLNSKHVKWFRNHVPLLNVNHFHYPTEMLLDPTTSQVGLQNTSSSDDEHDKYDEGSVIKITELSQAAANPNSEPSQSIKVPVNNKTALEWGQIRNNLLTNSTEQLQLKQQLLLEAKTIENANEYAQVRKLANMSAKGLGQNITNNEQLFEKERLVPELYINEFGELVINKVSQYFAGKYTCLAYHRQSEVLLDVLANSQAANSIGSEGALKLDGRDQANPNLKMASESTTMLDIAHGKLIYNLRVHLNSDDHETGNRTIEDLDQQGNAESADNKLSILDQINSRAGPQNEYNFDGEAKSKEGEKTRFVEDHPSLEAKNKSSSVVKTKLRSSKRDDIILKSNHMNDKVENVGKKLGSTFDSPDSDVQGEELRRNKTNLLTPLNFNSNLQRIPAQIVNSEIIQLGDLKNIPGFLYSKQYIFCPIGHLQWKYIYPLVRPFCPKIPQMISGEFRCYHLAWRLISGIVSESASCEQDVSNSCENSILDISWFKDGNQLKFDANGRERNYNLGIKLINTLEPSIDSTSPEKQQRRNEENGENILENSASLPKANLSNKWICPLRGRTIEIDGVRKDSVGRYTCALRMKISKLREIIQKRYKAGHRACLHQQSNSPRQVPLDSSYSDTTTSKTNATGFSSNNDILCCNGQDKFSVPGNTEARKHLNEEGAEAKGDPFKFSAQVGKTAMDIETIEPENSTKSNQSPKFDEEMEQVTSQPIKTNSNHPLTKQIAIFKSILERRFSREQWLEYTEQQLSRLQDPLAVIQSFSLLVAERSANSSDLWSTITEASNAYTRRKLSDFKRFKRCLERDQQLTPGNVIDVYTFNDKLFSSTTTTTSSKISEFNPTEATGLPKLYDEQVARLDGSEIGNCSTKIKDKQQGDLNEDEIDDVSEHGEEIFTNARGRIEKDSIQVKNQRTTVNELNLMPNNGADTETKAITDQQGVNQIYSSLNNANDFGLNWTNQTQLNANSYVKAKVETSDDNENYIHRKGNDHDHEDESESDIGIEGGVVEQIESRVVHSRPFNYVNERNWKPFYTHSGWHVADRTTSRKSSRVGIKGEGEGEVQSGDVGTVKETRRLKRSPISAENQRDYLKTKELITQRGSRGLDNESERRNGNGQSPGEDNLQANNVANWHPPVIDDLGRHKMFMSLPKFDPRFSSTNSNYNLNSLNEIEGEDEENEEDDNDSYPANRIRGDGRINSFEPAVAAGDFISKTQKSVASEKMLPTSGPTEWSADNGKFLADQINEDSERYYPLLKDKSQLLSQTVSSTDADAEISLRHTNLARKNQTNRQFAIDKPNSVDYLGAQVDSVTSTETIPGSNVQQNTARDQINAYIPKSSSCTTSDFNKLDESLMWSAGQYLYMHMKALASSSIFGIEVGVEWSNERSNSSNLDLSTPEKLDANKFASSISHSHYPKIKSPSPFATIDVISGQNLYLQCTAHALGRLPEVKWYKLVNSIPKRLKRFINLARQIGNDLYWPLTEINLLEERNTFADRSRDSTSFTCSQSTVIFDNLENSTFTVISSLQLGQYNDVIESEAAIKSHSITPHNYNLYACIVDADVRHNYATLGVHLREKPSKIPLEISKRLHARSIISNKDSTNRKSRSNLGLTKGNGYDNYDLFRQNHIRVPLKSYWIPIHNEPPNSMDSRFINDDFILTPTILSVAITIVFTSLLALIYLTMRSYRTSNQLNFEAVLENSNDETTFDSQDVIETGGLLNHSNTLVTDANLHLDSTITHRCICHLDNNLAHQNPYYLDSMTCNFVKLDQIQNNTLNDNLYQAHSHPTNISLISALPSSEKTDYSHSIHNQKLYRHFPAICCTSASMQTMPCDRDVRLKINVVRNPLDSDDDQ